MFVLSNLISECFKIRLRYHERTSTKSVSSFQALNRALDPGCDKGLHVPRSGCALGAHNLLRPLYLKILDPPLQMFLAIHNDTTISVSGTSKQEIETKLNDVLKEVYDWTAKNKLLMNSKKTKVMVIGTKQRCSNLSDTNLNVKLNNVAVECVNEAKCLGVTLDSHLTFNSHVNNIATNSNKTKNRSFKKVKTSF